MTRACVGTSLVARGVVRGPLVGGTVNAGMFLRIRSDIYISYATLSSGIHWNIPRVTCILSVCQQNKFHGIPRGSVA